MTARALADYMAGSAMKQRTIVQSCKYQPIARLVQHDEAKAVVAKFIRGGSSDAAPLTEAANKLRQRLADAPFDRDLFDHNADYIDRLKTIYQQIALPKADILPPGQSNSIAINGVKVKPEIHWRHRRLTSTNKIRIGAGMLRYAKGKALSDEVGAWQSAFILGYLNLTKPEEAAEPENKLCITLDVWTGKIHPAPTDSKRRFQNIEAACDVIAERWPNIKAPEGAVL